MDREQLKDQIEQLEFLKYADSQHHQFLLEGLLENIIAKRAFFFPHGENYANLNGRLFSFDAESLVEGGAIDNFREIRNTLEKAGLTVHHVDQIFETTRNSPKPIYKLTINGNTANFSAVPMIPIILQGGIIRRYSKLLNRTLRRASVKERVYFMNDRSSDTELAILTPKQAKFINQLGLDKQDRVYKFGYRAIWAPVFQIIGMILSVIFKRRPKSA